MSLFGGFSDLVSSFGDSLASLNPISGSVKAALKAIEPKRPKINIPAPVAMPVADSKAIAEARRRAISRMSARGGRASTILTQNQETLG